ncbi:MAG: hypothetical protein HUU15_19775, partial [Candidatus Brocadiae bacterium]|nr:hypothetical protein [Candidatus Brocadiia bacterium]
ASFGIVAAVCLLLLFFLVLIIKQYKRCPSNRVLDHLALHRPGGVVVTDLELSWDTGSVRGLSVNAGAVDALAGSLSEALEPGGRSAATGPRILNAAGLYSFEIRIGPAPRRASAAPGGER